MTQEKKKPVETVVKEIEHRTRQKFSSEEKTRIILEGF